MLQSKPFKHLPQPAEIEREWARRRIGRFVTHIDSDLVPARHHGLINAKLEEVEAGLLSRLMIFCPPGHGKSTYASHYGPAWMVGRKPKRSIVHAAHTADLVERFGRKIRNTIGATEFIEVFGAVLSDDSRAAGAWTTLADGEYKAAGVGGAITGRRGDIGLIDDPVKGRQQADSPTYRETAWQWYLSDFRTRLKPGAAIILIMTRWHEDDLAGRILPKDYDGRSGWVTARDGEQWYVLNFPAICEREDDGTCRKIGEALWPEYYTLPMLLQEKLTQGSRNWDALYQQRPRPGSGGIFQVDWFNVRYNHVPVEASICVHSWDTAQKENELNDPSALTVWRLGRGAHGYYLQESLAEKLIYPKLKQKVLAFAIRDEPDAILIEDKSSGTSLIQDLRNDTSLPIIAIEPEGDKVFRASEVSARCEAGLVHLPMTAPWLVDYEGELFAFPISTYKDQVDSTTQFLKWVKSWSFTIVAHGTGARPSVMAHVNQDRNEDLGHDVDLSRETSTEGY